MQWGRPLVFLIPLILSLAGCARQESATGADPEIEREVATIRAIDNHAHPMRVTGENEKDNEFDAIPMEAMEPAPLPVRLRPGNAEYAGVWKQLFNYGFDDVSEAHVKTAVGARQAAMKEKGDGYPAWVLDRMGSDIMLANRVYMGRGLAAPRFRWVPFADPLLFPFDTSGIGRENPDYRNFYPGEEKLLKRYSAEAGAAARPPTLDGYLNTIVTATLEHWKQQGAVALKYEAAYLRGLDFGNPPKADAERLYAAFQKGKQPTGAESKPLEDYIFRHIAREAGRLGMALHIHACAGAGGYFKIAGTNPLLMEPLFNDPGLRKTNFVIVHGGWPFTPEARALLVKPNVYADFSGQTFILYPADLAQVLRGWLEFMPEHVLFGSDASPYDDNIGWAETGTLSVVTGRKALALALSGMMRDGEISRARAGELARMVLRENAAKLYGF